ncbi:MAG: MBL fold metallo-hydrolase [Deltaproteobacteria bacterium]|nr:MBL fold metallo-hydrolase [Deltaproteobacteria bacterium]
MYFKQFQDPESFTYTYLLADLTSKEAVLIDPVKERVEDYLNELKSLGLHLKYTLDTHVHADHITGSGLLREKTGAESVLGEYTKATCVSKKAKDGEELSFGPYHIKVIYTPGHTPCHVAYLVEDRLFTGDALFINGCGRTDFQGGSAESLWESVVGKLFKLPPDTLVYPGHDYKKHRVSTIQQEKDLNPRFHQQTKASFVDLMKHLNLPDPKKIHEAVPANETCGL